MTPGRERRAVPRTTLGRCLSARVPGLRGLRLRDLSLTGAQIEHLGCLRPGAPCALDLPPPGGTCPLPAEVVWCTVIGRLRTATGESHLVARSGLQFPALTLAQRAALVAVLTPAPRSAGAWPDRAHGSA
jgi:hypothetical protein